MSGLQRVGILATGCYVPERILSNEDLESMVDTSDEWITTRTGIKERRLAAEDECTSDMAVKAARRALETARVDPKDLDLILVGTVTGDYPFPSTACLVQEALGATNAGACDIAAACSGFLYALKMGQAQVATGAAAKVLVIGAETLSRVTDYEDRTACILFGDGAGAAVLSNRFEHGEVLPFARLAADGGGADVIRVLGGGSRRPLTAEGLDAGEHFMRIRGREVYKFAVAKFVELVQEQLAAYPDKELGLVIPHQVNQRIIESARNRLGLPEEMVYSNIDRYGNTSAASIPIALDEVLRSPRREQLDGKLIVFCAFGAGLTWASGALCW